VSLSQARNNWKRR